MTPEERKIVFKEARAWATRDGRRAMKLLDLRVSFGTRPIFLALEGQGPHFNLECEGHAKPIPAALAVAFLRQLAAAEMHRHNFGVFQSESGGWEVVGWRDPVWAGKGWTTWKRYATGAHACIAGLLASEKMRKKRKVAKP